MRSFQFPSSGSGSQSQASRAVDHCIRGGYFDELGGFFKADEKSQDPPFQCEQGETELWSLRSPFSHPSVHTLALCGGDDLNSVAVFEDT